MLFAPHTASNACHCHTNNTNRPEAHTNPETTRPKTGRHLYRRPPGSCHSSIIPLYEPQHNPHPNKLLCRHIPNNIQSTIDKHRRSGSCKTFSLTQLNKPLLVIFLHFACIGKEQST